MIAAALDVDGDQVDAELSLIEQLIFDLKNLTHFTAIGTAALLLCQTGNEILIPLMFMEVLGLSALSQIKQNQVLLDPTLFYWE